MRQFFLFLASYALQGLILFDFSSAALPSPLLVGSAEKDGLSRVLFASSQRKKGI